MKKPLTPLFAAGIGAAVLGGFASSAQAAPGVYFPNCDAAIAAHAAPILAAEPGYRPKLDADHDGVACDKHLPRGYVKKAPATPTPAPTKPAPVVSTPAPTKPAPVVTTPAPAPTKPAPTATTPAPAPAMPSPSAKPTAPAPSSSAAPAGPVVQTDLEARRSSHDALMTLELLTGAAGFGAWGLRRALGRR